MLAPGRDRRLTHMGHVPMARAVAR